MAAKAKTKSNSASKKKSSKKAKSSKYREPNDHDKAVMAKINEYYTREPDLVARLIGVADKPLEWLATTLPSDDITVSMEVKKNSLEPLAATASETFTSRSVLEDFDPAASSIEEVRKRDAEEMWKVADKQYDMNALMTGLNGFGTGMGGPAFVASDVPGVFMTNFRLGAQVAMSFGYDWSPEQFPLLLQSMALGLDNVKQRVSHRQTIFIYLKQMQEWIDDQVTEDRVDEFIKRYSKENASVFAKWTAEVVEKIGSGLASKALSKLIPVLGGAANAGINIWMATQTHHAAQALFAERRLRDDLGDKWVDKHMVKHDKPEPVLSDEE